jgi:hypothetical protein
MTFHADFWVVAGTAAPVIALSSILVLGDLLRTQQDIGRIAGREMQTLPVWKWPFYLTLPSFTATYIVTLLQAITLFSSLMSLVQERNYLPTTVIAVAESFSLVVLGFTTLDLIRLKPLVKHLEETHFPPQRPGVSPRPYRNPQSDAMRRAAKYRSSHQIARARSARRAPQPKK